MKAMLQLARRSRLSANLNHSADHASVTSASANGGQPVLTAMGGHACGGFCATS